MKRKMYFHDVLSLVSGFLEDNANFQIFAVKMGFSYDDLANSNLNGLLGPFLRSPQGLDILKYGERSTYDPMKPFIEAALGRTRGKPATTHDIVTLVACFLYDNANFQIYAVNHGYTYSDLADAELVPPCEHLFNPLFSSMHGLDLLHNADRERDRWERILAPEKNEEENES